MLSKCSLEQPVGASSAPLKPILGLQWLVSDSALFISTLNSMKIADTLYLWSEKYVIY